MTKLPPREGRGKRGEQGASSAAPTSETMRLEGRGTWWAGVREAVCSTSFCVWSTLFFRSLYFSFLVDTSSHCGRCLWNGGRGRRRSAFVVLPLLFSLCLFFLLGWPSYLSRCSWLHGVCIFFKRCSYPFLHSVLVTVTRLDKNMLGALSPSCRSGDRFVFSGPKFRGIPRLFNANFSFVCTICLRRVFCFSISWFSHLTLIRAGSAIIGGPVGCKRDKYTVITNQ